MSETAIESPSALGQVEKITSAPAVSPATHTEEGRRLLETQGKPLLWRHWGPYVSERSWGTVREDYSANGAAWDFLSHDMARSKAYRWGEDGLAAICDRYQVLVFGLAVWNGKDAILKERAFGLTPGEGNHGEDVKEYYFYLDNTRTHSYMKYLYKYSQVAYPYGWLLEENRKRGGRGFEFELLDTGIFDENRYFDVFVEYAKASGEDLCIRIEAVNRGPAPAPLHVIPQLWFRNTWSWTNPAGTAPVISQKANTGEAICLLADDTGADRLKNLPFDYQLGKRYLYAQADGQTLFTDNETNALRVYGIPSINRYSKDAFHRAIVNGEQQALNPERTGTKACLDYQYMVPAGASVVVRLRLRPEPLNAPLRDVDQIIDRRRSEADEFYTAIHPPKARPLFGGTPTLASYMPLHIEGLHWVIGSRMDLDEALKPVNDIRRLFSWWGAGLFVMTLLAAWFMTRQILRPVNALVAAARKVGSGDLTAKVEWKWKDELGVLSDTFNSMTTSIREKTELIEQKNCENEALLLNILPGEIANRLKSGEQEIADNFAEVTVLFGDLVGFTTLSSEISASEVVDMLNGLFSRFDQAANELFIEKIKTIGDCYMAVCGLPKPCPDHAERMARMALRMVDATREYGAEKGLNLRLRIGLNSGPVVAGVIGTSKFIYDLWGDTVNLASRMESTGVPGEIQVTRNVYERLKNGFELNSRGVVQVKGKGEIETWLLHAQLHPVEAA